MRIKPKTIFTWAIAPAAALLVFLIVSVRTFQAEDGWASAAQENTDHRVRVMRQVQVERQARALAVRIERLSRGLIRQAQAEAVVAVLHAKCDDSIRVELLMRLIDRESRWTPTARGRHGEVGLCQLKPSTAGIPAAELADPARNVAAGIDHLRMLVERTGSVPLALAAYNGGLYSGPVRYAVAVMGE